MSLVKDLTIEPWIGIFFKTIEFTYFPLRIDPLYNKTTSDRAFFKQCFEEVLYYTMFSIKKMDIVQITVFDKGVMIRKKKEKIGFFLCYYSNNISQIASSIEYHQWIVPIP